MADATIDRLMCGEPADARGFFRCQKNTNHSGDRHHTKVPGGDYWWGYVPTIEEKEADRG
ncbi:hypothetical protein ACIODS_11985 [Micromonospora chalcea]|uniref:hypothetical protein n=1 Tax=Micromonospora chalcea TaxID=1874 RepID=UPI00380BCCFE